MSVVLPKQIQREADEAERISQELEAARQAPIPPADNPDDPPAQPALEAPEPSAKPEPPAKPADDWEQRYKTLQGMMTAEQTRAQAQAKQLQEQLTQAQAQIAELAKAAKAAKPTPNSVTDKDVEAFGTDLVDLAKRVAADQVAAVQADFAEERARLETELASLKTATMSASERQAAADRGGYFAALTAAMPDYQTINADERFLDWCRQNDPLAGVPRQTFLDRAFDAYDVATTARLFQTWKDSVGEAAPPPANPLARQVTPKATKASAPVTEGADTKIWTTQEVDQFYADVRKGTYRGRDAEAAAIEAQIDLAVSTQRIR